MNDSLRGRSIEDDLGAGRTR